MFPRLDIMQVRGGYGSKHNFILEDSVCSRDLIGNGRIDAYMRKASVGLLMVLIQIFFPVFLISGNIKTLVVNFSTPQVRHIALSLPSTRLCETERGCGSKIETQVI